MVAPFNQAWMLLKQRGHELNLPLPRTAATGFSPQDLTDSRVDEASIGRGALDEFEYLNSLRHPTISNSREAKNELGRRQEITNDMERQMSHAKAAEINEAMAEQMQRKLDQQTLARMGQQSEADEMEAMGMPEMDKTGMPMSRSIGGGPAPNEGRAGSSGRPPVGSDDVSEATHDFAPAYTREVGRLLNELGPLSNPFPKSAGQNVRGDLMDWASGAGRKAGVPDIVERTEFYDEDGNLQTDMEELSDMHDDDMYSEIHGQPLDESNPAAHSIASTTLRASPRQQRRGQMDSGRSEFKRPDREGPIGMSPSQRMLQQMQQMDARKEAGF